MVHGPKTCQSLMNWCQFKWLLSVSAMTEMCYCRQRIVNKWIELKRMCIYCNLYNHRTSKTNPNGYENLSNKMNIGFRFNVPWENRRYSQNLRSSHSICSRFVYACAAFVYSSNTYEEAQITRNSEHNKFPFNLSTIRGHDPSKCAASINFHANEFVSIVCLYCR